MPVYTPHIGRLELYRPAVISPTNPRCPFPPMYFWPAAVAWIWPNGDSPKRTEENPRKSSFDYFELAGFNLQGTESCPERNWRSFTTPQGNDGRDGLELPAYENATTTPVVLKPCLAG